jgi:membrane fusion protein (multidrug efflux system)
MSASSTESIKPSPNSSPNSSSSKVKDPWWTHPRAKKVMTIGSVVACAGVLIWYFQFRPFVSTDDARVAATLVRLAPEGVSGKVIKLAVSEGDRVKTGQIVLELDHELAKSSLMKAKAKATQTNRELQRIEQLAAQKGVPLREVDNIRAAAQISEAELQLAQIAYDRTYIKSPVDGIVVQKVAELGNILEPNQTALTIADIDHAWIAANIEETAISLVKIGQPVAIHVDEGGELSGKVSEIRAATASQFALIQSENPSGNFTKLVQRIPIKIALDSNIKRDLRSGESVEIKIKVH